MTMEVGAKQVSVTFDDGGNVTSIVFAGEGEPRDLNHPDGELGSQPMSLEEYGTLAGFQTVTVLTFNNQRGAKRICVKLMNCSYFCA